MEDGIKISELIQLATLNGEGEIPIVNNDETKRINVVDLVYPVGSIYMSVNSTNPGTIFGGTWEQIQDRFLLACGNTYANGSTGGEATHQLTISEMPSHEHILNTMVNPGTPTAENHSVAGGLNTWASVMAKTQPEGGSVAHNNMPPYFAVYVWKRTA